VNAPTTGGIVLNFLVGVLWASAPSRSVRVSSRGVAFQGGSAALIKRLFAHQGKTISPGNA
jgi:hypothetical protein